MNANLDVRSLIRQPSAFVPFAMSLAASAVVLGSVLVYGVARQSDEGAAAHIWQLLVAGQIPLLAFFAFKWLPRAPLAALRVLALQLAALLVAAAFVYFLHL